jgi:uncharacterized membrane protein SirB2
VFRITVLATYYGEIKWVHIACALASGTLFSVRGALMLYGSRYANHVALARLSYVIDTTLLAAAVLLVLTIHQYPFVRAWLTVKVLLLFVYIFLGIFALRRGKTRRSRAGFFLAALVVYGFIISVAVTHNPVGVFQTNVFSALINRRG